MTHHKTIRLRPLSGKALTIHTQSIHHAINGVVRLLAEASKLNGVTIIRAEEKQAQAPQPEVKSQ